MQTTISRSRSRKIHDKKILVFLSLEIVDGTFELDGRSKHDRPWKNSLVSLFERVGAHWDHWQEEEGREEENKKWLVHYGAVT